MDALQAAAWRRSQTAPAATHISQRAGTAKQMHWPRDDDRAWDRAHPQARVARGAAPLFWPLFAFGFCLGALARAAR